MTSTQTAQAVERPDAGAQRGMSLTLRVWRQQDASVKGKMVTYRLTDISPDMSFLEMLDVLNEQLILDGEEVNQSLEKAGRVADFLELGELM